jgi:hypothetical protein
MKSFSFEWTMRELKAQTYWGLRVPQNEVTAVKPIRGHVTPQPMHTLWRNDWKMLSTSLMAERHFFILAYSNMGFDYDLFRNGFSTTWIYS